VVFNGKDEEAVSDVVDLVAERMFVRATARAEPGCVIPPWRATDPALRARWRELALVAIVTLGVATDEEVRSS
jgi:hypothetical protein